MGDPFFRCPHGPTVPVHQWLGDGSERATRTRATRSIACTEPAFVISSCLHPHPIPCGGTHARNAVRAHAATSACANHGRSAVARAPKGRRSLVCWSDRVNRTHACSRVSESRTAVVVPWKKAPKSEFGVTYLLYSAVYIVDFSPARVNASGAAVRIPYFSLGCPCPPPVPLFIEHQVRV